MFSLLPGIFDIVPLRCVSREIPRSARNDGGVWAGTPVTQDGEVNSPLQRRGGQRMREQGKRSPILVW
jgi:hypothetical protein